MLDDLIVGLVLLGIGALTWLAYNHPRQYRAVYPLLVTVVLAVLAGVVVWWAAIMAARIGLIGVVDEAKVEKALAPLTPQTWPVAVGFPGACFFLWLLRALVCPLKGSVHPGEEQSVVKRREHDEQ